MSCLVGKEGCIDRSKNFEKPAYQFVNKTKFSIQKFLIKNIVNI